MRGPQLRLLLPTLALGACLDTASEDKTAIDAKSRLMPPDAEIMAKAYDPEYRVPEGFYVDERAATAGTYSLHHVKDPTGTYELCADSYDEALRLEDVDNGGRSVQGTLVGIFENDRYYEFLRELNYADSIGNVSSDTSPGFARVFKCSYVDREGVERLETSGYRGHMNSLPLAADALREFNEYLWQFAYFWPANAKVLASTSSQTGAEFEHSLLLVLVTRQAGKDCDRVEVADWAFTLSKADGRMSAEYRVLRAFEARNQSGSVTQCLD